MSEYAPVLQFGIEAARDEPRTYVDVPTPLLKRALRSSTAFAENLALVSTRKKNLLGVDTSEATTRIFVNTRAIARTTPEAITVGRLAADRVVAALGQLFGSMLPGEQDPRLSVHMSRIRKDGSGGLPMSASVLWPSCDDDRALSSLVTRHMQATAKQLKYPHFVTALIRQSYGVDLETGSPAGPGLRTYGFGSGAEGNRCNITATGLYASEQQLICFTGLVAFATADRLLLDG